VLLLEYNGGGVTSDVCQLKKIKKNERVLRESRVMMMGPPC
jgi:hypothetical protein